MPARFCLLCVLCCLSLLRPAASLSSERSDTRDFQKFAQQTWPVVKTDPKQAVALYEQYLQQHPALHPNVAALLRSYEADILYNAVKNPAAALTLLDQALSTYGPSSPPERRAGLGMWLRLVREKAEVLVGEKRLPEAEALWRENLPNIIADAQQWGSGGAQGAARLLHHYIMVLEWQNKGAEVITVLERVFKEVPWLLSGAAQEPPGSLYDKLVSHLLKAERKEDALRWAKVQYLLCNFDTPALERATKLVGRAWASQEAFPAIAAFAKAQQDSSAPNPLQTVPLPEWDTGLWRKLLAQAEGPQPAVHIGASERITLLLALGEWQQAMLQARRVIMDNPTDAQGVRDVARVFKAKDLNVVRANAFLQFYQSGEGPNPITAFLQETEKAGAEKAAPPTTPPAAPAE
ncbi:MAG: hypothetical protein M3347_10715 [Armatimonadota bacterium]|nr:hypothetical protein [Armatimonadota bacterium]